MDLLCNLTVVSTAWYVFSLFHAACNYLLDEFPSSFIYENPTFYIHCE